MADTDLYDTDILAWSEQQAMALRELAVRRDLPNALDLAHVVEEIEDVGASQLSAVKSFTRLLLTHAIKCWAVPDAPNVRHWLAEMGNWRTQLRDRYGPSMNRKIDLNGLWRGAVQQAILDLRAHDRDVPATMVQQALAAAACPVSLDDVIDDGENPSELVARLSAVFA